MSSKNMTLGDAAVRVLTEAGEPLHYREITQRMLAQGLVESGSKTPDASMSAVIAVDLKRHGKASRFVRVRPGVYGLRSWGTPAGAAPEQAADGDDSEQRVFAPYFPVYSELRLVLPVWNGKLRSLITGLHSTLAKLRGTPQDPADWTSPDEWIPERLHGDDRKLAQELWRRTHKKVNPRHVYGHWLTACNNGLLLESASGSMELTSRGHDFVAHPGGDAEMFLDEGEGVLRLLDLIAKHGPARPGEFVQVWGEYVRRTTRASTESTIRHLLHCRLRNLLERGLISRSTVQYSVTDAGLAYLGRADGEDAPGADQDEQLLTLVKQHNDSIRESVHALLAAMDPIALEHLVKRLLEAMNYDNVTVTAPTNDKGVDVVADIELGITSVREVVQVKRHKRTIQRKDLDALRGSLHRFGAVRGTIITTGTFARGTREAAFEQGAAPITLIDGAKLVGLLIEHGLGVKKKEPITLLEIDHEAFAGDEEMLDEAAESE